MRGSCLSFRSGAHPSSPLAPNCARPRGERQGPRTLPPRSVSLPPRTILAPRATPAYNVEVIPIRDTVPSRTAPLVTVALIAVNVLVFLHETALGPHLERYVFHYGFIPQRFVHWADYGQDPWDAARFAPLFTSMFWHGGWLHLLGNMLYLWVFGDNVEHRLGHLRYLLFYVLCGLSAAAAQIAFSPNSALPTVGASGAIAGVLGAYLVSFPRSRVVTMLIPPIPWFVQIPAMFFLAFWFLMQLLSGVVSLGQRADNLGGVAWWAHIGGFIAGIALVKLLEPEELRGAAVGR